MYYMYYFHNQNIRFVEQGAWKKSCTFVQSCQWGYQALHCVHAVFVPVFQCHALKRHRPILTKTATGFFFAPDLINSVISQYSDEYGQ